VFERSKQPGIEFGNLLKVQCNQWRYGMRDPAPGDVRRGHVPRASIGLEGEDLSYRGCADRGLPDIVVDSAARRRSSFSGAAAHGVPDLRLVGMSGRGARVSGREPGSGPPQAATAGAIVLAQDDGSRF